MAIVNTHLPHGVEKSQFNKRVNSFNSIFNNINFNGEMDLLNHDILLLLGDLNFRIKDKTRDQVIQKVQGKFFSRKLQSGDPNFRNIKTISYFTNF